MQSKYAQEFLSFVNESPSPFHAVAAAKKRLQAAGFKEVAEKDPWNLQPSGKYYFTRNQSTIVAFAVGKGYTPGNGFSIIAAHTDSPCLKLKPVSKREGSGYLQVGVQTYGGGLWHTWFDRDLGIAGRVILQKGQAMESKLVRIDKPILRIPTLAIHLDRGVSEKLEFNKETQLTPVLATAVKNALNKPSSTDEKSAHHSVLLELLGKELGLKDLSEIIDFELCLFDTQPGILGGIYDEFIFAARLDNLYMSYTSLKSLLTSLEQPNALEDEPNVRLVALFDNEEVGSESANGAASNLLETTMRRLAQNSKVLAFEEAIPKSFLVSADMAHAIHPNYADKHESKHQPAIHKGVVIKTNANQRYASNSITASVLRQVASTSNRFKAQKEPTNPLQEFVVRNDSPCGSTIGPILSARVGLRTVDVGCPQLSMHSIREMAGVDDLGHAIELFTAFFEEFPSIDSNIKLD